jgi:hypothetical protein
VNFVTSCRAYGVRRDISSLDDISVCDARGQGGNLTILKPCIFAGGDSQDHAVKF